MLGCEKFIAEFFRQIDSANWDDLKNLVSDGVVYERPGYRPFVGVDEFMRFYREERNVNSGRHVIDRIFERGKDWVCIGSFRGKSKAGDDLSAEFVDIYTMSSELILRRKTFFFAPLM
ncbi:hypothetical protein GCM10010983_53790 [Caulobacter rhizosphaerae]|jgi:ketosteroid isomerase-like protein|nr:hypothetical protein GCM10010983_53790 [Caulobacter rhizosphaerae]